VTATVKRAPGRPKTPLDVAESQAIHRVADLAVAIMQVLRLPEYRGRYSSEAELKRWVADNGHRFTSADSGPALWLLADTGRLRRASVDSGTGQPRGGWISPTVEWSTETPVAAANGES
jgi:hypothetical protein